MELSNEQKDLIQNTINNFDCESVASLMRVLGYQWYDSLEEKMIYPTPNDIRKKAIGLMQSVIKQYNYACKHNKNTYNTYIADECRLLAMYNYRAKLSISFIPYRSEENM